MPGGCQDRQGRISASSKNLKGRLDVTTKTDINKCCIRTGWKNKVHDSKSPPPPPPPPPPPSLSHPAHAAAFNISDRQKNSGRNFFFFFFFFFFYSFIIIFLLCFLFLFLLSIPEGMKGMAEFQTHPIPSTPGSSIRSNPILRHSPTRKNNHRPKKKK